MSCILASKSACLALQLISFGVYVTYEMAGAETLFWGSIETLLRGSDEMAFEQKRRVI